VHTNKTLAALKNKTLIARVGTKLQILHWKGLAALADFDPSHLHLKKITRASGEKTERMGSSAVH
jgi:hypothetical protein